MGRLPTCECGVCKKCGNRRRSAAWRARNPGATTEKVRAWVKANPEKRKKHVRAYRERNPEAYQARRQARVEAAREAGRLAARNAVNNALRDGKLVRPEACDDCRSACKPHGHHEDYSKPLVVRWLCTTCHGRAHRTA